MDKTYFWRIDFEDDAKCFIKSSMGYRTRADAFMAMERWLERNTTPTARMCYEVVER